MDIRKYIINRSHNLPDATVQLQASNSNSVDTPVDKTPTPIDPLPSCSSSCTPGPPRVPSDLGEDKPNQVKTFSSSPLLQPASIICCVMVYDTGVVGILRGSRCCILCSMQEILNFSIRLCFHCKGLQCLEARCRGGKRP